MQINFLSNKLSGSKVHSDWTLTMSSKLLFETTLTRFTSRWCFSQCMFSPSLVPKKKWRMFKDIASLITLRLCRLEKRWAMLKEKGTLRRHSNKIWKTIYTHKSDVETRVEKKIVDRFSSSVRNACEKRRTPCTPCQTHTKRNCIESLVIRNYKHEVSINLMVNKIPFMSPVMCVYPLNILQEKERKERSNLEEWTLPISLSLDVFSFRKSSNHCWKPSHGWAWEWHQESERKRKSRSKMKWHKEESPPSRIDWIKAV